MAKYKYLGPNLVVVDEDGNQKDMPSNCYGVVKCMTGDVVDLPEHLAKKADKNPNYKKVKPGPKPKTEEESRATQMILTD